MAVAHMVWMKFSDGVSETRIAEHLGALAALPTVVSCIEELTIGENFTDRANGFTHGMIVTLPDRDALPLYANHPKHVEVAGALRADASILAMDYEY